MLPLDSLAERRPVGCVPFPTEAARDVLGLLSAIWSAEEQPDKRRALAKAGHQVLQALELAATNEPRRTRSQTRR